MAKATGAKGAKGDAKATGAKAPVEEVEVETPIDPAPSQADVDAEALEKEVDVSTAAPAGVNTANVRKGAPTPEEEAVRIVEVKNEDGDPVRRLAKAPGRHVAVGNEIFNKVGVLIGTEATPEDAARKADRYNSLIR